MLTALLTDILSLLATLSRRFPDLLLTLNIAVDLAVVEIRAGVTGLIVSNVSGIDDGTKNLICLVHERVGHADITKHLRQREVLGRDKMVVMVPCCPFAGTTVVFSRHAGSEVNIGGPCT